MSKHRFDYKILDLHIYFFEEDGKLQGLSIKDEEIFIDYERMESEVIKEARKQLEEYFLGERKDFNIPLDLKGTEFQLKVWKALLEIPYGETRSYKEIAKRIGNEKASRAIGNANNKNPIYFLVPCHRVIGADGKLVGYGGGLDLKKRLLDLEVSNINNFVTL